MAPVVGPLQVVLVVWSLVLGCIVGSFLNVVIWRLPHGLGIGEPARSICPRCRRQIRWYDNIPILSFAILGGKCRDCGGAISWRYPAIEALTGAVFALICFRQGVQAGTDPGQVMLMMLVAGLLIAGSVIDVEWLVIPDEITAFGLAGGLLAGFLVPGLHVGTASYHTFAGLTGAANVDGLIGSLIGALGGGLMVLVFALLGALIFRREAMGFGDVKLMAMVGAFFGWKVVVLTFFLAPFIGLVYGVPLLLSKDEHVMPYGPFLSIAALVVMVFRAELCAFLEPLQYLAGLLVG